jgi:hypothetical protein
MMLEIRNEMRFAAVAAGVLWALTLLAPAGASAAPAIAAPFTCTPSALVPGSGITCTSTAAYVDDVIGPSPNPIIRVTKDPTFLAGSDPRGLSGVLVDIPESTHSICRVVSNVVPGAITDFTITAVTQNAACQKKGAAAGTSCNGVAGDCILPCIICETAQLLPFGADPVSGLTCPGDSIPGLFRGSFSERIDDGLCTVGAACPAPAFQAFTRFEGKIAVGASTGLQTAGENTFDFTCTGCPNVKIKKTCPTETSASGECLATANVTVSNLAPATEAATNCVVTDLLDGLQLPLSAPCNAPFNLAVGQEVNCTASRPIDKTTGNTVKVECDPSPNPACHTEDTAEATCTCGGSDFKCYAAKIQPRATRPSNFKGKRFSYSDQFTDLFNQPDVRASVLTPTEICNPVDKNGEGIKNPDAHLMCYKLLYSGRTQAKKVIDTDQFGSETLRVGSPVEICLPAMKNGVGNLQQIEKILNHYACYRAATEPGTVPFPEELVSLTDQWETNKTTTVTKTALHCNPILTKDGTRVPVSPSSHLKCYDIQDTAPLFPGRRNVTTDDQWYSDSLQVGRATRLCETASKELLTPVPLPNP